MHHEALMPFGRGLNDFRPIRVHLSVNLLLHLTSSNVKKIEPRQTISLTVVKKYVVLVAKMRVKP